MKVRAMLLLILAAVLLGAMACSPGGGRHEGKTLDQWVELAQGPAYGPAETVGEQRKQAFGALAAIGAPAVPALQRVIGHTDERISGGAIRALHQIGEAAEPAVQTLIRQMGSHENEDIRKLIPPALAAIAPGSEEVQRALLGAMMSDTAGMGSLGRAALLQCFGSSSAAPTVVEEIRRLRPERGNLELQKSMDELLTAAGG
jgi:hypothetical protein